MWSPDYEAVVGIVGQAHSNGDGRAVTLHQADLCFPDHKLAVLAGWSAEAAGEVALQQWGWSLVRDPEGVRHWRPRARGVSIESERGYRFRGRTAALSRIAAWLDRPEPDRRILVVTGSPGVGKSAVLGRIVTTADATIRASLPPSDEAVRASVGSVSCAVHAKGKTALEVAEEIARATSARLPEQADDLAPAVRDALGEHGGVRFNVIIDALDEAVGPAQTREIIDQIALPLAETCSDGGAQVVVGTRRRDDGGDLLVRFGGALAAIDLDDPDYFAEEDLAEYAMACLQLTGGERPGNPYADDALAAPLASRIAAMSGQNFLVAGLIARAHGLHDEEAADPGQLVFPATVDSALTAYLERLSPVAGLSASHALTALAFAEAPGLTAGLWQLAVEAIDRIHVSADDLTRFARSSAANFLVETGGEAAATGYGAGTAVVYRLFHQALNDALLSARSDAMPRADDERALTRAFTHQGRLSGWEDTPGYLLRSLPGHAATAGLVDDLLGDDTYLLHAELRRLIPVADDAVSAQGRGRARLLRLTPQAIAAGPEDRAALFSVTEALEDLGSSYRDRDCRLPYRAAWASVKPRGERFTLAGHQGEVTDVCSLTVDGRDLLVSAGADGTVRIWDPATGQQHTMLQSHQSAVRAVCPLNVNGRNLLASAGADRTVRIWDPATGQQHIMLQGHQGGINRMCALTVDGRDLLASADIGRTVRIWDPASGHQHIMLQGHRSWVWAVCPLTVDGRNLLASAGADDTVRIWDPVTGQQTGLEGHQGGVNGMCALTVEGRDLLASASSNGVVRIWDPVTDQQHTLLGHQGGINGVCAVTVDGRDLLASAGADGTVRIWDPVTDQQHTLLGHQGGINGVCAVTVDGRDLLASAGADGTVRIWDPTSSHQYATLHGHQGRVWAVCPLTVDGQDMLASASTDRTVRIWDPVTGHQHTTLQGHQGGVRTVCPLTVDGQDMLASASTDRTVRIWDPVTGYQHTTLQGHQGGVYGVCPLTVDGQHLVASASTDLTVRIWDPVTGYRHTTLQGHQGGVHGVCTVTVDGRDLLASAGDDGTVGIWDPVTGHQHTTLQSHQGRVWAVCPVTVEDQGLVASAGDDGTVGIWDPVTGHQHTTLQGHQGGINGVCAVTVDGRDLLASASADRTVRIWDPETEACLLTVPTHHPALAVSWVAESLAVGLTVGILVIKLNAPL